MKTAEEFLFSTISDYNTTVNDISKFDFNKREVELFTDMMEQYAKEKVLEALEEEIPKAYIKAIHFQTSYIRKLLENAAKDDCLNYSELSNNYYETEVKPKYQ